MRKRALTLMEIVVSLCILSLVMSGMLNVFIAAKGHGTRSRVRMTAVELGKYFLDPLANDVRQDTWGANCLSAGAGCPGAIGPLDASSSQRYTPTYNIGTLAGSSLNVVTLIITSGT